MQTMYLSHSLEVDSTVLHSLHCYFALTLIKSFQILKKANFSKFYLFLARKICVKRKDYKKYSA